MTTKIGIVGCGNISGIYFQNLANYAATEVIACADLDMLKAQEAAGRHGVIARSVPDLLNDPAIDIVLNLTVPKAHYQVARAALKAGKSVYNEKPLTISREEGRELLELAQASKVRVGCAPDTFLGAALQTCRKLIDDGTIGEPVGANAFMLCHGHESWHPSPEFYYELGGGPMFDMGPYYLTALITLMGPIKSVQAMTRATFPTRTITSEAKRGMVIEVETPTHIVGMMEFDNGAIGQIATSFDVWHSHLPNIEIYGTEGSLLVPDPNGFGGTIRARGKEAREWHDVPHTHGFADNNRGLGVMDMAYAIRLDRPHRASGDLAYHVLDAMHAFLEAGQSGAAVNLASKVARPAPLPGDLPDNDIGA